MDNVERLNWRAVNRLLDELLDMPASARDARLAEVAQEDPCCAREAAALLSHQATVQRKHFLDDRPIWSADLCTLAGERIGDYVLEHQIGSGGMGAVWLAHRADTRYARKTAIKFLNLYQLGDSAVECLRREASVLAKLSHPNITRLIDAGRTSRQPYLVLEYVEGDPVDVWCDARGLELRERILLFQQILAAVAHAHGRLILHRDLKPSNILVTAEGTVKLLDFGVAKLMEDTGHAQPASQATLIIGQAFTPEYAAPEQILRGEVTAASDVYSLGVLLYELLAGRHPTPNMSAASFQQLRALIEREPRPASEAALQVDSDRAQSRGTSPVQLSRALRSDLDNILAKALERDPAQRYATVDAFAADLDRYLHHEPVSARAHSRAYRVRKFLQRYRKVLSIMSLAALTLAASTAVAAWYVAEARLEREQARAEASRHAQRALAVRELLSLLTSGAGWGTLPGSRMDRIDRAVALLEAHYRDEPRFAGRLLVELGTQARGLSPARAAEIFARAYELGSRARDAELMILARCASVVGAATGEVAAMGDRLEEARRLLDEAHAPDTEVKVVCMQAAASMAAANGDYVAALAELNTARTLLEQTGNVHRASHAMTLRMLESIRTPRVGG